MSKNRSLRKSKISFDDDEEEEEDSGVAMPPASLRAAQQKREKATKLADKKAVVSFDDDDVGGGAVGQRAGGKARASLRAPALGDAAPAAGYTQVSAFGEYTAERLQELQRGTLRPPGSKPAGGEGAFKLSGSFKSAVPAKDDRFQHNVAAVGVREPGAMPLPPPPRPVSAAGEAAASPAAAQPAVDPAEVLASEDEGEIPDEQMIKWAKAKRERLRSAQLAPDYIPMAAMPGRGRGDEGAPAGRGPAEEDQGAAGSGSEGEPDLEDGARMQFVGAPRASKPVLSTAAAEGGPEDLEEEEAWAEEQIRKGMGGVALRSDDPFKRDRPSSRPMATNNVLHAAPTPAAGAAATAVAASQAAAAAAAADEAVAALRSALQRLQASSRQAQKNLERTRRNLEVCVEGIARAEGEVAAAGDKYTQAQRLRAYLADLCAMLADKSPLVEELEDELGRARAERAAARASRAAADDREDLEPAAAAVSAAIAALSRGSSAAEAARAADAAAEEAEGRLLRGDHLPAQLDEFGRDLNAQRRAQAAARVRRRSERLAAVAGGFERPPAGAPGSNKWREPALGDDTTDESEGEAADFRSRAAEVFEAAGAVFRDAGEEYGSVGAVKAVLEGWKAQYPVQYHDVYIGMSAPALFAPFVRLQLLRWAPLDAPALPPPAAPNGGAGDGSGAAAAFDQQEWYRLLFDYGMGGGHVDPGDADADLVPRLVRSLVLPLGERLLREVWNPFSARQSAAAAAMLEDLLVYVPAGDEGMQRVVRLVQAKLEAAAAAAELPAWPPAALAASRRAAAAAARRFGRALRLLRAAVAMRNALPADALRQLAIGKILTGVLLPYVRGAAADPTALANRAERIVAALPGDWLQGGVPRGAEALAELLVAVARGMEARAGDPGARTAGAAAAAQLARALGRLGDASAARRLAMMYGVQL